VPATAAATATYTPTASVATPVSIEVTAPVSVSVESVTPEIEKGAELGATAPVTATAHADLQATPPPDLPVTGASGHARDSAALAVAMGVMLALVGWTAWERRGRPHQ
jgi:hypothetical protein